MKGKYYLLTTELYTKLPICMTIIGKFATLIIFLKQFFLISTSSIKSAFEQQLVSQYDQSLFIFINPHL